MAENPGQILFKHPTLTEHEQTDLANPDKVQRCNGASTDEFNRVRRKSQVK